MENPVVMDQPRSNISSQGEVPHVPSGMSNIYPFEDGKIDTTIISIC